MYKRIEGFQFTLDDNVFILEEDKPLEKKAALNILTPRLLEYKNSIQLDDKYRYIAVIAVSAGETWGANRNGDYFPREELIKHYQTFENGYLFEHHKNKDPKDAFGRIKKAFWNEDMDRVELIVAVEMNDRGQEMMKLLEEGNTIDVSMGCTVPFDVCSICGNMATKRSEYCNHLKYHMNEILPDGRKVYAINIQPNFFDISWVTRGADVTAKVFAKVASDMKQASIDKEIPGKTIGEIPEEKIQELLDIKFLEDEPIRDEEYKILEKYPAQDVIKTLIMLKVPLKPIEVRQLLGPGMYMITDNPKAYEYFIDNGQFNPDVVDGMLSLIKRRSFIPPFIPMHKEGNYYNPNQFDFDDPGYQGYLKVAAKMVYTNTDQILNMLSEVTREIFQEMFVQGSTNLEDLEQLLAGYLIKEPDQANREALQRFLSSVENQPYYAAAPNEQHYKMIYKAASDQNINIYGDYVVKYLKNKGGKM